MFDQNTTFRQLFADSDIGPLKDHLIAACYESFPEEIWDYTLEEFEEKQNGTWCWQDYCYGLNRLSELVKSGQKMVYSLYEEEENAQAVILPFPAKEKKTEHIAIIMAGGGYGCVCSIQEAFPLAARLNEFGMDCYCLNYRTIRDAVLKRGLLPDPFEDLKGTMELLTREFSVDFSKQKYILMGFSAGGHLASLWGTQKHGARAFSLPSPALLALGYPVIAQTYFPDEEWIRGMFRNLYGETYDQVVVDDYDTALLVDKDFPPVYLVRSVDDSNVPAPNGDALEAACKKSGVPFVMETGENGGHGFGLGSKISLKGWVDRMYRYFQEQVLA